MSKFNCNILGWKTVPFTYKYKTKQNNGTCDDQAIHYPRSHNIDKCLFLFKLGMVIVLHVGEPEDLPPPPKTYGSCGFWPIARTSDGESKYRFALKLVNVRLFPYSEE